MRNKNMLFLALFIGAIGAFVFMKYQKNQKALVEKQIQAEKAKLMKKVKKAETLFKVVIAKHDILEGEKISKNDIEITKIPQKDFKKDFYADSKKIIGNYAKTTLYKGEPIRMGRVHDKSSAKKLSDVVKMDMRAMTIKITKMTGLGGFLKQGDRVDVVAQFDKRSIGETYTKIVLQNIKVLTVGKKLYFASANALAEQQTKMQAAKNKNNKNASPIRSDKALYAELVTLELTPAQAERLALVVRSASLVLILRSSVDNKIIKTKGTNPYEISGLPNLIKMRQMEGKGHKIIFIEGDKTTTKYVKN